MPGFKSPAIGHVTLVVSFSLATLIPLSCSNRDEHPQIPAQSMVKTARVIQRDFKEEATGYGYTRPSRQVEVVSYTRGRLERIWTRDGEKVVKGQRLFSIEGYFRIKEKEELGPREGEVPRGDANHQIIKTSPMEGYVSLRKYPGQAVQVGEILATIADPSELIAEIEIFGPEAAKVRADQPAVIAVPAGQVEGKVAYVASITDPRSGGRKVGIKISQENPWKILPGDFVRGEIIVELHASSMAVPVGAVLNDQGERVVIVRTDKGLEKRPIRTGTGGQDSGYIEVVDGVRENDEVVTEGAYEILHRKIREKIKPED